MRRKGLRLEALGLRSSGLKSQVSGLLLLLAAFSLLPSAFAAWGSLNTLGSAQIKTSGTNNLVVTTSAAAEVNNVIVCIVAADNLDTGADAETAHWSVSDSAGNTYTRAVEFENTNAAAAAGANSSIFFSKVSTQLASAGTITFTSDAAVTAKAASCWEFSIVSTNVVSVAGKATLANDGADPGAITISGLASQEYLWVSVVAHEGPNTDAFTQQAGYTSLDANGTTGAGAATNMSVRGGFRIFTGTTDTVDVTYTAVDHAQGYVALKEAAAPPAGGPRRQFIARLGAQASCLPVPE